MDLKTGVENDIIFCVKYRQDLEKRAAHPYHEFSGVPPPPTPGHKIILSFSFILFRFNSYSLQEIFTNEQRIILSCSSHKYLVALQGRF